MAAMTALPDGSRGLSTGGQQEQAEGLSALFSNLFGLGSKTDHSTVKLKAAVVLVKKHKLDLKDTKAELEDITADGLGHKVEFQLVSVDLDPKTSKTKVTEKAIIKNWALEDITTEDRKKATDEDHFTVTFNVPTNFGQPGALLVRNRHPNEFFLKSVVLELDDIARSKVVFDCNSVIFNTSKYTSDRIFFSNKAYLPSETPAGIKALRELELQIKQGDGTGERQPWERIYDYDVYNDLSDPDKDPATIRPVLGGSTLHYPRRIRTGRPPSKRAPELESSLKVSDSHVPAELQVLLKQFYLPRDELFSREKTSSLFADVWRAAGHGILPAIAKYFDTTPDDFDSFNDIKRLYDEGIDLSGHFLPVPKDAPTFTDPFTVISHFINPGGGDKSLLKFPVPEVFKADEQAWSTDQEFARQFLAGMNPLVIERLREYPPKSSLDPEVYGPGTTLTDEHILPYLDGLTVTQAIEGKRLFTVDYHDIFLPYIGKQNAQGKGRGYAPRTIFFLTSQGTLKPIAIELALEKSSRVFTAPPADAKEKDYLWELAKLHANTVDCGYHQLISHWLETHAAMEPIIIATNRQLSAIHPIHVLLLPHFRNTMNINGAARQTLIQANGIIENNFTPGRYCMEMTAVVYGAKWRFDRQALPEDLIARGLAEPADSTYPGGVKLVIEDYPFAKDGLELWDVIKNWVGKYVELVYKGSDEAVQKDTELQAWWKEVVEVGHGDLKGEAWWPKLDSLQSLAHTLTTIIWIAGPHHASVNFGQFAYEGYMPNRPSMTRKLVPEPGSPEHQELLWNPEKYLLSAVSPPSVATSVMTTIEILSTHAADEEYLGQRQDPYWTSDPQVLAAFKELGKGIGALATNIQARNDDKTLLNRWGPAKVPYTLLYPYSAEGLTGQGVPNSTSI